MITKEIILNMTNKGQVSYKDKSKLDLVAFKVLTSSSEARREYLRSLSVKYGVDMMVVFSLAYVLGEDEDYDELVSTIENMI